MSNQPQTDVTEIVVRRETIGLFLRARRQKCGLSQKEVAETLGYGTGQFVSNWERGLSMPPLNALKQITKIYGIKPIEFMRMFDEMELGMAEIRRQEVLGALGGVG